MKQHLHPLPILNRFVMWLCLLSLSTGAHATPGDFDIAFNSYASGPDNTVRSLLRNGEGKLLVGGQFTHINGATLNGVARLNADGSLDSTFNPGSGATDGSVNTLTLQSTGKIFIGGDFYYVNGTASASIARLNTDGSLDTGFTGALHGGPGYVSSSAVQTDDKILVGGQIELGINRLNSDGTADTAFNSAAGTGATGGSASVNTIALQSDGSILAGGSFNGFNGHTRNGIVRLLSTGAVDTSFTPGSGFAGPGIVHAIALQTDGKILVGGGFSSYNGTTRSNLARLNSDGSLDTTFNAGSINSIVKSITVQADGKLLIGGLFSSVGGSARNALARLNSDGSLDSSFAPPASFSSSGGVLQIIAQPTGRILLAGSFSGSYLNTTHYNLLRLTTAAVTDADDDGAADSSDAFPLNGEAKIDSDGDGKPDSINLALAPVAFIDNFNTAPSSANGWSCTFTACSDSSGSVRFYNVTSGASLSRTPAATSYLYFRYKTASFFNTLTKAQLSVNGYVFDNLPPTNGSWSSYSLTVTGGQTVRWSVPPCSYGPSCGVDMYLDDVTLRQTSLIEDADDDNDGTADIADAFPLNPAESLDTDHDGIGNNADLDDDGDGVPDYIDANPLSAAVNSERLLPLDQTYRGSAVQEAQTRQ